MKICDELRQAVLQAAIQGKLTDQRKEDGDARDLLKQIRAEKEKLIKEGKIKKEKPLDPIKEDEIPFDIPENWGWCYIGDIFQHNTGKALNGINGPGKMLSYITTSNLYWNKFELDNIKSMPFTEAEIGKCTVQKDDLLVCEGGDFGRAAIWAYDNPIRIQNHIHRLRSYGKSDIKYFYYIFYFYKKSGLISGKGIGIQGLSSGVLHKLIVPIPPLAEQHRIVTRIEELMSRIDDLEKTETELESMKSSFPDDMKASLLQAAMQGKLTEQLKSDGDAGELLREIKKEKEKLVKEGKIKKEKPLEPIKNEEIPFDIPEKWRWVKFSEVVRYNMGKTPPRENLIYWKNDIPWVSIADMPANGHVRSTKEKISSIALKEKFGSTLSKTGTLLMSFKLTVGRVSILDIDAVHNEAIISIYPIQGGNICRDYLFKILPFISQFGDSKNAIKGKTLNNTSISNMILPFPPLAEQRRIVEKLDRLLPLCDGLKEKE